MNTMEVIEKFFKNDDACLEYLCNLRWAKMRYCPYCKSTQISKHTEKTQRSRFQCSGCKSSFSATVNTIMHKTKVPLFKWFIAVSMLIEAKKSISSRQLARHLKLPVNTTYALVQKIRKGLLGNVSPFLQGIIEIDETYIGGKPRYKGVSKRGRGCDKIKVVGMVERKGKAVAFVADKLNQSLVRNMILENVDIRKSTIYTDEYGIYNKVDKMLPHESVNHGRKEYVRGGYTQTA